MIITMIKVFISQPMNGLTEEEVMETRKKAITHATKLINEKLHPMKETEIEFMETYIYEDAPEDAGRLWYLGRSIQELGKADFVYFVDGWEKASGCISEAVIADLYEIPVLYRENTAEKVGYAFTWYRG